METQPLFPDSQLLILLSYLACGFLNTTPISLPADLSSIATHLGGTKTSLKCRTLGTGYAVLFPAKGKSVIWVRVICLGWWLVGNGFPIFVFLKVTGKNSGFEWWLKFSDRLTSVILSGIWDSVTCHWPTTLSMMFFRKPSFVMCLCVE